MARFFKGLAVALTAVLVINAMVAGGVWLFSADEASELSDVSEVVSAELSDISDASDVSDVSAFVSDVSDVSREGPLGDVNDDGHIDMKDVLALRRHIAHLEATVVEENADVCTDSSVDMKDVLLLRQYIAHWDVSFGVPAPTTTTTAIPEPEDSEMRAVWVAYYEVASLMKGSEKDTKAAIDKLMDNCVSFGANTVFFHVRANSDAYYDSDVFSLNSSVSALIKGGFDPLTYTATAAHTHGLELHAWINPYRIGTDTKNARCKDYFEWGGRYYYNPASKTARELVLSGIRELCDNYDIDGIHMDDYFYPDGISDKKQSFDIGYTSGDLGDWRRAQVSLFVKDACALVHERRPDAVFGISPQANLDNDYNRLYADVKTWMAAPGYLDYICPQVYYGFKNAAEPFKECVEKWCGFPRADGVKMYVGLAVYKAGLRSDTWAGEAGKTEWLGGGDILARQVQTLRRRTDVDGFALFSYGYLMKTSFTDTDNKLSVAETELKNLLAEIKSE